VSLLFVFVYLVISGYSLNTIGMFVFHLGVEALLLAGGTTIESLLLFWDREVKKSDIFI
jgi:hypothetical protein